MSSETLLYIIFAGIIALLLALFQYLKKQKSMSKINMLFAFLRFITFYAVLLLVINPKFTKKTLSIEKPNLVIAIDNSSSVGYLGYANKALALVKALKENPDLQDRFNLIPYTFGKNLENKDSISFSEKQTHISEAFKQLAQIHNQSISPTLLISDGNQTYGNDYEIVSRDYKQPVFPVILGDTITYTDLKIQQLNVNKYAFLKNDFPVEIILVYNGNSSVNSILQVKNGNHVIYSQPVSFSKKENSKVVTFNLPANQPGIVNLEAFVTPLENEKNIINNSKNFAIEVINQKTKIAIISNFSHPDIGALKKSIESNEQCLVELIKPNYEIEKLSDFQLIIVYQPNNKFKDILEFLKTQNRNAFYVVGTKTDLYFLNKASNSFSLDITNQSESYQAELNLNYSPFVVDDIDFESFPPLLSNYGDVNFTKPLESILNKTINGVNTNTPLLATSEKGQQREAFLFGENIWQWRAQSYLNEKSFDSFDKFIGKLIQYLALNQQKSRLNIDYESFYDGNTDVIIKAEFFDKNYVFDIREVLTITVIDEYSKNQKTFPLVLKNNYYQVDLSNLPASKYSFQIKTRNEKLSKSGRFQILDFNVEQQFLNADVTKLKKVATNTGGKEYFISETGKLVDDLLNDSRFVALQKSNKKNIPLIDWKYLLAIIVLSLSAEWFLRKYNGLI
ncbi:VWA domain-containing protein [uncultured Algibacter sp.]|uniref:VWA domain-containing protein n=1 Tax=uncultured Algibacter sp. TaxID=298659 RepID=UPI00263972F2|nr:VWA domain-containing protein [uncultured Algibacter sp.]